MTAQLHDPVHGYSDPDRLWTTTNVAEATPDILTPMCWSVFGDGLERAWLSSMGEFGVLGRGEQVMSDDPNRRAVAAIFGRQVVNIAVLRSVVARLPGVRPDDVERDIFGSVRPGLPAEPSAPARIPIVLVKFPRAMVRIDHRVQALYARQVAWWRTEVLDGGGAGPPSAERARARLEDGYRRFGEAMAVHAQSRFLLSAAEKPVVDAFVRAGHPERARELLSAYGGVTESAMADALWQVAHAQLTVDQFLRDYGFHGPNEGNVYTHSWRERPERLTSLVAGYRSRGDRRRPRNLEAEAMRTRRAREGELLALLPPRMRPLARFARDRAAGMTRKLELGKAAFLMALDGCRAATRELGAALAAQQILADPDDAFFLTAPEHLALSSDTLPTEQARALIAHRREQRALYERVVLPRTWTGMPDLAALLAAPDSPATGATTSIRGVAWGGSVVEGRARVVLDPNHDTALDEGDILVCRFTDPSWAPLFTMAEGLVIDIGGPQSHGAVVAREMGIPYVIGTETATRVLRDGDRIRVDGSTGEVTVLAAATQLHPTPDFDRS